MTMGDNEENATNPEDDQEASEAEGSEERPAVRLRGPVEEGQGLASAAPADDVIIIK
jgi:hypothetical protein